METEVTTTDGGGATGNSGDVTGYSGGSGGYDNEADYSSSVAAYDVDSYYKEPTVVSSSNSGDSGGVGAAGWFGEILSPRPVVNVVQPTAAAVTKKSSYDMQKISTWALVAIGLLKLKLLSAIKFLVLLAVKLKALTLLKLLVFAKFAAVGKLFNLFLLPFLPNWLTWLRNITTFQMNSAATGMSMASVATSEAASSGNVIQQLRNDSVPVEKSAVAESRAAFLPDDGASSLTTAASLLRYVATAKSDKCVERLTCHVVGTRPLNFRSVLVDW